MARKPRREKPRGLDAELAQLLDDPTSIGYAPQKVRRPRRSRRLRVVGSNGSLRARRRPRAVGWPSPIFVVLVLLTAAGATLAATRPAYTNAAQIGVFVFVLAGWLVSVCLHEFAHAYFAHRGGDDAIEGRDYLRLNPFKYVHPVLSLVLPLVYIAYGGIGLPGGAVLVHRHRLRSRVWRSAVSAAGPLVNIAVTAIALVALHAIESHVTYEHGFALFAALGWFAWLQIAASILNLIPIPGLDGFGIIEPWLSEDASLRADRIRPYGLLIVVVILWVPTFRDAFSRLVEHVATLVGDPLVAVAFGEALFKFWH